MKIFCIYSHELLGICEGNSQVDLPTWGGKGELYTPLLVPILTLEILLIAQSDLLGCEK